MVSSPGCWAEMGASVAQQAASLGWAVLLGVAVGLLYDVLRILRVRLKLRLLGAALDFLFWLPVTAAFFLFALIMGGGEVRITLLAGHFAGAVLYFRLLSPPVLRLGYALADLGGLFWRIATAPVRALGWCCKKIKKFLKNSFLYRRKWFRIRLLPEEMKDERQTRAARYRGDSNHADKTSRASD
ncbi:MAG TPA: spore cortex biosynthesis protein YabQ [Candidatus Galloscillospira stercoripullorum]|nr:spore cortex biosynthesis protein YabQ [Candidatus Galloscillospira stercoripullorum]